MLYARVFVKILDSSLASDWTTRHVFEDLLKLANQDGVVDMTHSSIARRTNAPLEVIVGAIARLEEADPNSRNPIEDGRRIVRLDDHRDWGWSIVNWSEYDAIRTELEHREANARSMRRYRKGKKKSGAPLASPPEGKESDVESEAYTLVGNMSSTCNLQAPSNQPETQPRDPSWPSIEGVLKIAELRGIPKDVAECWYCESDARGGRDGRNVPIARWESALRGYWVKWQSNGRKNGKPAPAEPEAPSWRQREALQLKIDTHPANPQWIGYMPERTNDSERAELKTLRAKLQALPP